ncbi:MAG: SIMPL domain-containing protein [Holosporales bacterium]|jgi:hypothetical protein|nr:SIMPL domain-containing protein [Holosporales bacterium]
MFKEKSDILKLLCCLLAIGLFYQLGCQIVQLLHKSGHYISTKGLSERVVESDLAILNIKIIHETDKIKAVVENRKKDKESVMSVLRKVGIEPSEIQELPMDVYNHSGDKKDAFRVTDTIRIRTKRVEIVKTIIENLLKIDLSDTGYIDTDESYYYTDMSNLRIEMLEEAAKDSRDRAQKIAKLMDSKVTNIKNLATGPFSIVPADSSADNEYRWGGNDTPQKRVKVVVNGSYEVE